LNIAVTASGDTIASPVDYRFGRAQYFILYDTETETWSARNNDKNSKAAMGAGIGAARDLDALGVAVVLTGHCGTWAFQVLTSAGIGVYVGAEGNVGEAIDAFEKGKLTKLQEPNTVAGETGA